MSSVNGMGVEYYFHCFKTGAYTTKNCLTEGILCNVNESLLNEKTVYLRTGPSRCKAINYQWHGANVQFCFYFN